MVVDRVMAKAVDNYLLEDGYPEQAELSQDRDYLRPAKMQRRRRLSTFKIEGFRFQDNSQLSASPSSLLPHLLNLRRLVLQHRRHLILI